MEPQAQKMLPDFIDRTQGLMTQARYLVEAVRLALTSTTICCNIVHRMRVDCAQCSYPFPAKSSARCE